MPIATPQGTLDFKSVDTITFVGASSNTVIDTTTGSLGVGVDGNGPTSNLHVVGHTRLEGDINMLHTSNNSSMKVNSNVVTEFPRSKKLIKYPREAIPGNNSAVGSSYTYTASDGDYVIKASSEYDYRFYASNAFDNNQTTQSWLSNDSSGAGYRYISGNPITTDSVASSTFAKFGVYGEWLELKIPTSIYLNYVVVYPMETPINRSTSKITSAIVWGSNTGNDGAWQRLSTISDVGNYSESNPLKISVESRVLYNYYALQITTINPIPTQYAVVSELEFWGTPEYDPEAHGVDVVVKSVPNVPNTDWLDIYIDGQDYSTVPSGVGSVLDKSTNNRHGTPSNVTFNSTWKAFEIESASTSNINIPFNSTGGDYIHTIALWFLMDTTSGGNRCIFTIRGSESTGRQIALIVNQDSTSVGFKYDFYGADVRYHDPSVVANKWMHVALTYSGGDNSITSKEIYLNGVRLGVTASNSSALNLTGNENLLIGGNLNSGNASFEGMVANFRMFNRVLSKDDIYQLYAYQKEYFGHGDLGMTLKAGRLGIGTSEPRAALDVRGRIMREYNPGEIIETIQGKANGRYVKVQSGTYLLPNVGAEQDLTTTFTRINGSNFDYTPPPGTTRVIYEFWFFLRRIDDSPILHVAGRVDGSHVNDARHTFRHQTDNIGTDPQIWIYNHMCVSIGEVTSDNIAGGQVATWNGPRTIDFSARIFSGSFDARLHKTNHWEGSGSDILVRPTIKITAIA
ncbi:LamG domain-containing protein [bacterium]|nr:LamG domain-containing protein [bacterium]